MLKSNKVKLMETLDYKQIINDVINLYKPAKGMEEKKDFKAALSNYLTYIYYHFGTTSVYG